MTGTLKEIGPFTPGLNPSEAWDKWRHEFLTYMRVLKCPKEDEKAKIALFLRVCGPELLEKCQSFRLSEDEQSLTLQDLLDTFDEQYNKNETYASFVFWSLRQEAHEPFDSFLARVRQQAGECNFNTQSLDRNIRDLLVLGVQDDLLRQRLFQHRKIKLEDVIIKCKTFEQSRRHAAKKRRKSKVRKSTIPKRPPEEKQISGDIASQYSTKFTKPCSRCGLFHEKRKCPAHGTTCKHCGKLNHWKSVCKLLRSHHGYSWGYSKPDDYSNSSEEKVECSSVSDNEKDWGSEEEERYN